MKNENFFEFCGFQEKQLEAAQAVEDHTYILYGGAVGGGKIVANNGVVLTPFGWKKGKDMKVGMLLNNPDGTVQRIIQIKPEITLPLWRVTFSDGTYTDVAEDHLWLSWRGGKGRKIGNTRTFGEKSAEVVETRELKEWLGRGYVPQIPVCKPQPFNVTAKRDLMCPYLLGVLLGDGCFTKNNLRISHSLDDQAHYRTVFKDMNMSFKGEYTSIKGKLKTDIKKELKACKLDGLTSSEKFIPDVYKMSSVENRLELVRGLMDTDGYSAPEKRGVYYYSVSKRLADDMAFILRSLGAVVTITSKIGSYKKDGKNVACRKCYCLYIKHRNPDTLFKMKRKQHYKKYGKISRSVADVRVCGKIKGRCITVSSPNGLYITNDFIVTHNSYFLRWIAVWLLMKYASQIQRPGIRVGLFCEDYIALNDRHLTKIQFEFPPWLGTLNKGSHEFTLADRYGAGVIAFRNLDDPSKYLSSEFAAILVDELTMNERDKFNFLDLRRRWPGISNTKFIGATNPGGVGHGYVKKLWIDQDFTDENFDPTQFKFVQAKSIDNKYLPASYSEQLKSLPEKMRKAFMDGDWDIFEGQYFPEFSRTKHVIEPFEIPKGWTRFRSIDYGYQAPACCLWYAVDYDGNVYVYRELYTSGLIYQKLAEQILEMTGDENIEYTVADWDMFAVTRDTGEYGYDIMGNHGVPITHANKERIPGWNLVRKYLQDETIKIFSTCTNLVRTFPTQIHSKLKPEDLQKGGEDHAVDSCRMGLMSLPQAPLLEKQPEVPNIYRDDPSAPWNKPKIKGYKNIYSYR